jgi:hypothetical protein
MMLLFKHERYQPGCVLRVLIWPLSSLELFIQTKVVLSYPPDVHSRILVNRRHRLYCRLEELQFFIPQLFNQRRRRQIPFMEVYYSCPVLLFMGYRDAMVPTSGAKS